LGNNPATATISANIKIASQLLNRIHLDPEAGVERFNRG
jgi:hypothetical protein